MCDWCATGVRLGSSVYLEYIDILSFGDDIDLRMKSAPRGYTIDRIWGSGWGSGWEVGGVVGGVVGGRWVGVVGGLVGGGSGWASGCG